MSRELKFRAWDGKKVFDFIGIKPESLEMYADRPKKIKQIMQYTGLKDKNGVEIYDGDIVLQISSCNENIIHIIKYNEDDASFIANNIKLGDDYNCGLKKDWCLKKEVIGNIYENHELLDGV